jgi:hypothetical protein
MSVLELEINAVAVSMCVFINRSKAMNDTYKALSSCISTIMYQSRPQQCE